MSGRAKSKAPDRTSDIVWCERGWQPVEFGFCPSAQAWRKEMRRMNCREPYPTYDACVTEFVNGGRVKLIVTLNAKAEQRQTRLEIAGLLCHEATHIWQHVRQAMREENPSKEFEAYSMQAIFQSLYQAWLDTRAPEEMLAVGHVRQGG